MAKLYLKGISKPFTIDRSTAMVINRIIDDPMVPKDRQFDKDGMRFCKSDVRYVIENDQEDDSTEKSDSRKKESEEYYNTLSSDFRENIVRLCKRDVELKAQDTKLFSLVYLSIVGTDPDTEIVSQVVDMQREYFEKNPRHPYAKINFMSLLSNFPVAHEEYQDMRYGIGSFGLRFLDRTVSEAFREAHYQKLI